MARLPRFFVPGFPLHVIQRGNNRARIFDGPGDMAFYRDSVYQSARRHGVSIHAYVFMTNHVHLLATPATAASLPKMLQAIGRVYVQYFNTVHRRTGTLWEGRYRAAIVDDERYLLTCMRYIELNPVRAGMVAHPADYPWSSHRATAYGAMDRLITPHAEYRQLDGAAGARRAAYRELFRSSFDSGELHAIRDATQHAWALGSDAFRDEIARLSRRSARQSPGRPRTETRDPRENRV